LEERKIWEIGLTKEELRNEQRFQRCRKGGRKCNKKRDK
jgi:hypothetical protein